MSPVPSHPPQDPFPKASPLLTQDLITATHSGAGQSLEAAMLDEQ
jgi:hypothetical protein